ncbi:glycosyltransferase family 2 protein [uncultured Brachyspira sp.]|uniref:glycosyltransferase family 2 protein n=1 Tax=uncultured Brachyspira sp. TaxID=221953 RepID=UPI002635DE65|nr:glycosyltransferase family 2 protein [uncultured Brachyspira sp.]
MNNIFDNILYRLDASKKKSPSVFISIIIPVYNTEKYLNRCINSIINQKFQNFEIIIVNDCSPGNCEEIIKQYNNNKIIYIKNEQNLGSAWTRINGLSYATGKYVHFVDSDDWIVDDSYDKIFKYLKRNFDALYFNGVYADDEKTWEYSFHIPEDSKLYGKRIAFDKMFFNDAQKRTLWCRVFKRDIAINGAKYMPREHISVADDWILNLFILFHTKNYRSVSDIFYYYYQDNPNAVTAIVENKKNNTISFNKLNNNLRQLYISYNAVVSFLKEKKVWNIYRSSWVLYIIRDLKYSFIEPFKNFDGYFNYLLNEDKDKYTKESLEYFNSNISNLNILNFLYLNLLDASGIWERNSFKYSLISLLYKLYTSIIRIRNYPQAVFKINVTKNNEYRRMYIRLLFFKITLKLKSKDGK